MLPAQRGRAATGRREMAKQPGKKGRLRGGKTGEGREQAAGQGGEGEGTSSRGDLRSGGALSSLNILADLIPPALFQR